MPRISAGTVREHRAQLDSALVDAAEELLRDGQELTAGAVAQRAGIARNSIYRYVESIDDLRLRVLARHMPRWMAAVQAALEGVDDPRDQILVWTRANLEQASRSGHGWLMGVAQGLPVTSTSQARATAGVDDAHSSLEDSLRGALRHLVPARSVDIEVELVRSLVNAGFRLIDAGHPPRRVVDHTVAAVAAVIDGGRGR